jgi:hypothetical protein
MAEDDLRHIAKSISLAPFRQYFDHLHDRVEHEPGYRLLPPAAQRIDQGDEWKSVSEEGEMKWFVGSGGETFRMINMNPIFPFAITLFGLPSFPDLSRPIRPQDFDFIARSPDTADVSDDDSHLYHVCSDWFLGDFATIQLLSHSLVTIDFVKSCEMIISVFQLTPGGRSPTRIAGNERGLFSLIHSDLPFSAVRPILCDSRHWEPSLDDACAYGALEVVKASFSDLDTGATDPAISARSFGGSSGLIECKLNSIGSVGAGGRIVGEFAVFRPPHGLPEDHWTWFCTKLFNSYPSRRIHFKHPVMPIISPDRIHLLRQPLTDSAVLSEPAKEVEVSKVVSVTPALDGRSFEASSADMVTLVSVRLEDSAFDRIVMFDTGSLVTWLETDSGISHDYSADLCLTYADGTRPQCFGSVDRKLSFGSSLELSGSFYLSHNVKRVHGAWQMGIIGASYGSEFSMATGRFVLVSQNDGSSRVYVGRQALDFEQLCEGGKMLYSAVDPKFPMNWKIQIGISIGSGDTKYMSAIIDTGSSVSLSSARTGFIETYAKLNENRGLTQQSPAEQMFRLSVDEGFWSQWDQLIKFTVGGGEIELPERLLLGRGLGGTRFPPFLRAGVDTVIGMNILRHLIVDFNRDSGHVGFCKPIINQV